MLEYDTKYINTLNYLDAIEFFYLKTRTYTGVLPRATSYSLHDADGRFDAGTGSARRKSILDTNFYTVPFRSRDGTSDMDLLVDGYADLAEYTYVNNLPPVLFVDPNQCLTTSLSGSSQWHPCAQTDGTHIGGACESYTSNAKYRFRIGDVPRENVPYHSGNWIVPFFNDTIDFFYEMGYYTWSRSNYLNAKYVAQMRLRNLVPIYMCIESEDFYPPGSYFDTYLCTFSDASTINWKALYDADNRFPKADLSIDPNKWTQTHFLSAASELAMGHWDGAESIGLSLSGECSHIYDLSGSPSAGFEDGLDPSMVEQIQNYDIFKIYGRQKNIISMYPYYANFTTMQQTLISHGQQFANAASRNTHNFVTWIAADFLKDEHNYSTRDDPTDELAGHGDTIAPFGHMFAAAKLSMASGTSSLYYIGRPVCGYFALAAAIDEMQPYHEYIKYGTNHVVPASHSITTTNNIYYGKDYYNNVLTDCLICCRIYNNKMMFAGCTFDESERDVTVLAPTGRPVSVSCSPFVRITIHNMES